MLLVSTYIAASEIEGVGVFAAARNIAAGEEITCNYHEFYEGCELVPDPQTATADT